MTNKSSLFLFALVLLCASFVQSQNAVVISPPPQFTSYTQFGVPNAFGCVFTYSSGSTSPLPTYTDYTGSTLNQNPVVLSAGGTANIWLAAGSVYSFQVKTSGGINCASGSTLYTVSGVGNGGTTQTTVVPFSPTPAFPVIATNQLFTLTLTGNAVALPISVGGVSPPSYITFQITQDIAGGHTFTWPVNVVGGAAIGSVAGQETSQMFVWNGSAAVATGPAVAGVGSALGQFLSPTLSTPIVNGVFLQNTPGTYFNISNAPAGTNPFLLVALTGSPNSLAMTAPAASTGGIVGICLASTTPAGTSCGTSGTATIEQSGEVFCLFDGTPAAGDYVQISSTVAGNCHDAGANYPGSGQVLGRVISSAGSNPFLIDLFGPEIQAGGNLVYTAGGTLQAHAHTVVTGVSIPGGGTATINITGAATFGSTSSCVGTDSQGPNPVQVKNFGGPNTIEVIGTIGDSVIVICVGQ